MDVARRFWPLLIFPGLTLSAGLVAFYATGPIKAVALISLGAVPTAWGITQWAYQHVEKFRLSIDRRLSSVMNAPATWTARCEFMIGDVVLDWHSIVNAIRSRMRSGDDELARPSMTNPGVWSLNGITVRARLAAHTDPLSEKAEKVVVIDFKNVRLPFRDWKRTIEERAMPVLEEVHSVCSSGRDPKLEIQISFSGPNPYFGFFIARIAREEVRRFEIDYFEYPADEQTLVKVRQTGVEFVSTSLRAGRLLSLKYLALQDPGGNLK